MILLRAAATSRPKHCTPRPNEFGPTNLRAFLRRGVPTGDLAMRALTDRQGRGAAQGRARAALDQSRQRAERADPARAAVRAVIDRYGYRSNPSFGLLRRERDRISCRRVNAPAPLAA